MTAPLQPKPQDVLYVELRGKIKEIQSGNDVIYAQYVQQVEVNETKATERVLFTDENTPAMIIHWGKTKDQVVDLLNAQRAKAEEDELFTFDGWLALLGE